MKISISSSFLLYNHLLWYLKSTYSKISINPWYGLVKASLNSVGALLKLRKLLVYRHPAWPGLDSASESVLWALVILDLSQRNAADSETLCVCARPSDQPKLCRSLEYYPKSLAIDFAVQTFFFLLEQLSGVIARWLAGALLTWAHTWTPQPDQCVWRRVTRKGDFLTLWTDRQVDASWLY